jgi:SAM-dependent methyltransferase
MKSSVELALEAFAMRPWRAEPLYDLARHYREKGLNEASLLFSTRGWLMPKPRDDLLFVENAVYEHGLREEFAICAFYSENHRGIGRVVCNELALDRSIPASVRETAWRNLFFYTRRLSEAAPSFKAKRIDFTPPDNYHPCNPSVCRMGNMVYLNVRAVSYLIGDDGRYVIPEAGIRTRNFLFTLDANLDASLMAKIREPADLPAPVGQVMGFEDIRLFVHEGKLWCSASVKQLCAEGWVEICAARIGDNARLTDWHVARPERRQHEKNWMPLADGSGFVYTCDPTVIVNLDGSTRQTNMPPIAADNWGGSSQLIPFDDGYLALIHERKSDPDPWHGQRNYQRRFVWFDKDLSIKHWSQRFTFGDGEGEFACGLCWHPDDKRLIISYGVLDREAWLATVDANEVCQLLGRGPILRQDDLWRPEIVRDEPRRLVPRRIPELPAHCDRGAYSWALSQTNRPLRSQEQIEVAVAHLKNQGLPFHHDPGFPWPYDNPKNWDNLIAVMHATATTAKTDLILDAGGTRDSAFLRGLHHLGYRRLVNFNNDPTQWLPDWSDRIAYLKADITNLNFVPDRRYDFVACLSVIEHGVDVRVFLREMARVIKPGGYLFVSFDYWEDPIDCGDRIAFGAPVRIFSAGDVADMLFYAGDQGLIPTSAVEYDCHQKVVNWLGLGFTFMNVLLRKS